MRIIMYSAVTIFFIGMHVIANAQEIQEQLDAIASANESQIDDAMKYTAEFAAKNMPMQLDAVTTVTGVMYLKQTKTLIYYGKGSIDLSNQQKLKLVQQARKSFCKSALNKAWAAKGVSYRYITETPNGKNDYVFDKTSCRF